MTSVQTPLTIDRHCSLLNHAYRRQLLESLKEASPRSVIDATEHITDPHADVESIRLKLYHIHLPKLDDYYVISRTDNDFRISRGENFSTVNFDILEALA